jgi:anti-sigma factor RsiW
MSDPDPAELSAFLDGELTAVRAAQVEAIIAADARVRAEYEMLAKADARWRSMALGAAFRPQVSWPVPTQPALPRWAPVLLFFIPIASIAGKLAGTMVASLAINGLALLLLVACTVAAASFSDRTGQPLPI